MPNHDTSWLPARRARHRNVSTLLMSVARAIGWLLALLVLATLVAWLWGEGAP